MSRRARASCGGSGAARIGAEVEGHRGVEERAGLPEQLAERRRHHVGREELVELGIARAAPAPSSSAVAALERGDRGLRDARGVGAVAESATVATVLKR